MNTNIYDNENSDELKVKTVKNFVRHLSRERESITVKFKNKINYYTALCTLYDKSENLIRVRFYNQKIEIKKRAFDEIAMCDFIDLGIVRKLIIHLYQSYQMFLLSL
ncbi:hypothetical protein EZS27_020269 [termite gut metagenome]|uniref:Uncharacterized protein n=1 Tax=termite gut metagenome TaxID=433724 RepID=A0A5J4RAJ3_9ZZZZ